MSKAKKAVIFIITAVITAIIGKFITAFLAELIK